MIFRGMLTDGTGLREEDVEEVVEHMLFHLVDVSSFRSEISNLKSLFSVFYAPNFLSRPALARASGMILNAERMPSSPFMHSLSEKALLMPPST